MTDGSGLETQTRLDGGREHTGPRLFDWIRLCPADGGHDREGNENWKIQIFGIQNTWVQGQGVHAIRKWGV